MIKIQGQFTDKRNKAYDEFVRKNRKASGPYVTVGVHEGAGQYESGVEVWKVALWNEFGVPKNHIPERSFIRSALDENTEKINGWRVELVGKIMDGLPIEDALDALGFRVQQLIQNKIKSNVPPPNVAKVTSKKIRDGHEPQTLMDTKLMLRSITFRRHVND